MSEILSKKNKNQNIQVFVRLRPINAREKEIKSQVAVEIAGTREVIVKQQHFETKHTKKFTFDRAFGPNSTQVEVYKNVVSPLIEEVLSGYSCTVFAYGQTGTGKTFTMAGGNPKYDEGNSWKNDPLAGIIPRSINQLFDDLRLAQMEFTIRVSYLELYNEELFDLLAPTIDETSTGKIRIFEDPMKKGSVIVQGLEEVPVKNKSDVYKIISDGQEKRKTAATLMNAQSSRSHTVFSILVHIKEVNPNGEAMLKTGKLNLVDLAGSENISKAGNEKKERARETVNINQSLLTLGRVITALVEKTPHIPYRESKLTRLLQDSLGGRTKTSIIATISPGHKDLEETLSTLDYAHRAKNITNKPEINQKLTQKLAIKGYTDEIDRLRKELYSQREKYGVYLSNENYNDLVVKIDQQDSEISHNLQKLRAFEEERGKTYKIFEDLKNKYLKTKSQLEYTKNNLQVVAKKFKQTEKCLKKAEIVNKEKSYLIDVQVKTEELLSNQARELINVAEITSKDTEKLHNVLDTRREIDHIIKTSAERFNDQLKNLLHFKNNCIDQAFGDCTNKNLEIYDNLGTFNECNHEVLEKVLCAMQNTNLFVKNLLDKLKTLDQAMMSRVGSYNQTVDQSNSKLIQDHVTYISTSYKEMFNSLSEEMSITCKERVKLDNDIFNSINNRINDNVRVVNKYVESNRNHTESLKNILNKIFDHLEMTDESSGFKEQAETLLNKMEQTTDTFLCHYESHNEESLNSFQSFENHAAHLNDKQTKVMTNINHDVSFLVDRTQKSMCLLNDSNKDHNRKVISLIDELADSFTNEYRSCLDMVERNFNDNKLLLSTQFASIGNILKNILSKNKSLDKLLENLSQEVNDCIKDVADHVGKYCSEELEVYRPSGETPVRKTYNYPKILASTSPHERILKRFRIEQGYNGHSEDLENSIIELDESFGDAEETLISNAEEHCEASETLGCLSKSRWLSEACIPQAVEPTQDENPKFKLTKSVSAIEINNEKHMLGKENKPVDRPGSASKYERNASSIPIQKRNCVKTLTINNT